METNIIEEITEAHRLYSGVEKTLAGLVPEYLAFLQKYNPLSSAPKYRILSDLRPREFQMEFGDEIEDGVVFGAEHFEQYFYFTMPYEYIKDPNAWLAKNIAEQEEWKRKNPSRSDCETLGCLCGGADISIHLYS